MPFSSSSDGGCAADGVTRPMATTTTASNDLRIISPPPTGTLHAGIEERLPAECYPFVTGVSCFRVDDEAFRARGVHCSASALPGRARARLRMPVRCSKDHQMSIEMREAFPEGLVLRQVIAKRRHP